MKTYNKQRARGSLQNRAHLATSLLDLSDDFIQTNIFAHLSFEELAAMHMVCQRFNQLLSFPDPNLRLYGSVTFNVDMEAKGSLPPWLIGR